MKTAGRHTRVVLWLLGSAASLLLATAGTAWAAQPPITFTDVSTSSGTFIGPLDFCPSNPELYAITVNARAVVHVTYFEDTGAVRFQDMEHGKAVLVPVDGTGPSYTGIFSSKDLETIRAVKHGDVLVETDTDLVRTLAHGSDGSRALLTMHAHFTVNANLQTTVQFEMDSIVCT